MYQYAVSLPSSIGSAIKSEYMLTVKSSPSGSNERRKSNSTGRLEYTSMSGIGESRIRIGADSSTLTIISATSEAPEPSSTVRVTWCTPSGSLVSSVHPLPMGSVSKSLSHNTLTRSVLKSAKGLQTSPDPLSGRSEQAASQSPDPVPSKTSSTPESVSMPSDGLAMRATGGELETLISAVAEFHIPAWLGRSSLAYMVMRWAPLDRVPIHSTVESGVTPEASSPSRSLQNSNLTPSPSGSKVAVPSRCTVADDVVPVRVTSNCASGISL